MKKLFISVFLVMSLCLITGCGSKKEEKVDLSKYAGTYTGIYGKFVGDETKVEDEIFSLDLNDDGTGKHNRNDMSFNVTWSVKNGKFEMTETFIGDPIKYAGTLKDGKLDIFNGDPKNDLTYEYVYEKK